MTRPFFPSPYVPPAAAGPDHEQGVAEVGQALFVPPGARAERSPATPAPAAPRFPMPAPSAPPVLPPVRMWVTPTSTATFATGGGPLDERSESLGPSEPALYAAPCTDDTDHRDASDSSSTSHSANSTNSANSSNSSNTTDGADNDALPWIDAFLAEDADASSDADIADHAEDAGDEDGTSGEGEWPLMDEAAEDIAELTGDLQVRDPGVATTGEFPAITDEAPMSADAKPRGAAPMGPWRDDEPWMDIMPAMATPAEAERAVQEAAAATAWAHALTSDDSAAAAEALESVAAQLRAGTLAVTGFRAGAGEAAALAATLSALLGARH